MRKLALLMFALLLCSTVHAQKYLLKFKNVKELQTFFKWTPNRYPLISAHRGGPTAGFPENAIETFANSIQHHPAVIECDASLTKDSALVMMHDNRLERTTNATDLVVEKTLAELAEVKLKDNNGTITDFHIPTLEAVLHWGKDKVIFTLDVKRGISYQKMIDAVRKAKAEAYCVMITYTANQAAEVHKLAPDLMISASIRSVADLERINQLGVPNNRLVDFVGTTAPDKSVYEYLHSKGIWCILGTMGNIDRSAQQQGDQLYSQLISAGGDILSSDRSIDSGAALLKYAKEMKLNTSHLQK